MPRFSLVSVVAALVSVLFLALITSCSAAKPVTPVVNSIVLSPTTLSVNEGQVATLSATALNSAGSIITADITFSSSNSGLASVSSAGLVCGGKFDSNNVVCAPNGDGQATITASSGSASATATVYVHKQVDRVAIGAFNDCTSAGQVLNPTAAAYNTSAPGCIASPCDITSTVGPFTYSSSDRTVVSSAAGINPNFSASTNSPTYSGGGTISGSSGQTCNLSDFSVGGGTGLDPTFNPSTKSPTYTSGGNITGSTGQTCTLTNFNGVTGASAVVTLTGMNSINSGTRLTVTARGSGGGSVAPTTATLTNGTATCSGTANVITSLSTVVGSSPVIGATGTVSLTGTNAIAPGTHLNIINQGFGATLPPTTATLSNGTATCSGTANIITTLNNATGLEAHTPGATALFASVAGVNSVGTPFTVCPVTSILVHDANGSGTNFSLQGGGTQTVTADVLDSHGQSVIAPLTWASSQSGAASVTSATATSNTNNATITGTGPGTTTVTATCSNPDCNIGLAPMYSYNVITASVGGASPDVIYAASTKSKTMVPIPATTNAAGTAITLPNLPNSILASPSGSFVYLGADSGGVMAYNSTSNAVSTLGFNGKVLAISSNGQYLVVYDSSVNGVYFYDTTRSTIVQTANGVGIAAALTPDDKWALSVVGQQLFRQGTGVPPVGTNLNYMPTNIGLLAQGSLLFITSSSGRSIDIRSTCDQSDLQTLAGMNPTFVQGLPNGTGAVAIDSPNLDVISTQQPSGSCPVAANSILASYNLQAGSFNPRQLLLSFDSTRAYVVSDATSLIAFDLGQLAPTAIPLAGGVQAFSGGITLDSQNIYLGATDKTVHRISVGSLSDAQQIAPNLQDPNSVPVAPDLVAVLPK